jgi:hypothetical protein
VLFVKDLMARRPQTCDHIGHKPICGNGKRAPLCQNELGFVGRPGAARGRIFRPTDRRCRWHYRLPDRNALLYRYKTAIPNNREKWQNPPTPSCSGSLGSFPEPMTRKPNERTGPIVRLSGTSTSWPNRSRSWPYRRKRRRKLPLLL